MTELLKYKYFYFILYSFIALTILTSNKISADQKIKIIADEIQVNNDEGIIEAEGNAIADDQKNSKIKSDIFISKNVSPLQNKKFFFKCFLALYNAPEDPKSFLSFMQLILTPKINRL